MSLLQKMFGKHQKRTHPYCAALIAAAGSSTRYGGENKLLQTLDGIPVLVRTLLTIDRVEGIDEIVIAAREDELLPYAELCKTFGLRKPVKVIVGGATRTESVLRAALEASPETEFFAVQDGARPLITVELIDEVLDAARVYLAAAPAVPVRDTIKVAHDGIVERTPNRSALFAVQTPQVFDADLIKGASEEEAVQRISVANLSFPPYMLAAVLRPSYFRESEFLHDVLMPAVSAILPNSPKLYQKGTIVALLESDRLGSVPEELMSQLRRLAAENGVLVGISNMFTRPERFAVYYRQAAQTAGFAKRQNNVSGVFLYSDCAFYLMLDGVEDKSMLEYAKHPLLSELEKYDAEKNTQLYDTLMTYTLTGFSKNRTAELMFLHRNTVNYRIQQISELYGLDFSDSALMFKLQYSFHVDSYLKHRYFTPPPPAQEPGRS